MDSMFEMKVGKAVLQVPVYNIIDQIPQMLRRGVEYKARIIRVDVVSDDEKKGIKMVAHWHIVTGGSRPAKGKSPIQMKGKVALKVVK